jgi:ABC-2 type transport system ATP-binding protein
MSDTDLVIQTDDLTKYYRRSVGCESICLRVQRGHIFGFLGPNGAGKSTFIKMMVGLHRPTSGDAKLLGRPLGDFRARQRVGFLPENFRYQEWLTPRELLRFHSTLLGMQPSLLPEATSRVLGEVGLSEHADEKLRDFSKGMQQRFGFACALLGDPELLFLDEPTSALDPLGRAEVRELLCTVRSRGTTVFLNSHLLGEVEQVCDEVAVIDHGRLVAGGTLAELLAGPCEVDVTFAEPLAGKVAEAAVAQAGGLLLGTSASGILVGLSGDDAIPALVERLVAAGARISTVARRRRTLESLFLEVTSDGRAHEDGEPAHG